jgi:AraC family transcriptional regulator of adaptative response / DNA-3-methyladenine glycosylase II
LKVALPYIPPFNFEGLLFSYKIHQMGRLEWFDEKCMHRIFKWNDLEGTVVIYDDPTNSQLLAEIDYPDLTKMDEISQHVRKLFDLDSDPEVIEMILGKNNPEMREIIKKHPGIRLPSGWDPFELSIATILGQLVSIEMARSLVNQLMELAGSESKILRDGVPVKFFPTPEQLLASDLSSLRTTNMRKNTLKNFAQALIDKEISLDSQQTAEDFIKKALKIKGIGKWTADYMALKVLHSTDAFPGTDLILARVLEIHSRELIDEMSPWRGYAAALFWREYSGKLSKSKSKK